MKSNPIFICMDYIYAELKKQGIPEQQFWTSLVHGEIEAFINRDRPIVYHGQFYLEHVRSRVKEEYFIEVKRAFGRGRKEIKDKIFSADVDETFLDDVHTSSKRRITEEEYRELDAKWIPGMKRDLEFDKKDISVWLKKVKISQDDLPKGKRASLKLKEQLQKKSEQSALFALVIKELIKCIEEDGGRSIRNNKFVVKQRVYKRIENIISKMNDRQLAAKGLTSLRDKDLNGLRYLLDEFL